jgi:hypothetical protein
MPRLPILGRLREVPSLYQPFGTPISEVPRHLWSLRPNARRSDMEGFGLAST